LRYFIRDHSMFVALLRMLNNKLVVFFLIPKSTVGKGETYNLHRLLSREEREDSPVEQNISQCIFRYQNQRSNKKYLLSAITQKLLSQSTVFLN